MSLEKSKVVNTADLYAFLEADDSNIMETPQKVSSREKKLRKLSSKVGDLSQSARNGFLMGAAVGGSMGAIIGIWTALSTKRLILLPISIITSGSFFGFMMMCGSIIRSDTENIYSNQFDQSYDPYNIRYQNTYRGNAFWKIKYSADQNNH